MNDLERIIAEMREQADKDKARSWPTAEKKHRDWADRLAALAGAGEFGHAPGCVSASADHPYSPVLSCCRPALAGAAPVAWRFRLTADASKPWGPGYWTFSEENPNPSPADFYEVEPLFTHAPAKAREDDARRLDFIAPGFRVLAGDHRLQVWWVTKDAEGRNVSHVVSVPVDTPDSIRAAIDAALATFAEGAE